jgi:hypothetical protein
VCEGGTRDSRGHRGHRALDDYPKGDPPCVTTQMQLTENKHGAGGDGNGTTTLEHGGRLLSVYPVTWQSRL